MGANNSTFFAVCSRRERATPVTSYRQKRQVRKWQANIRNRHLRADRAVTSEKTDTARHKHDNTARKNVWHAVTRLRRSQSKAISFTRRTSLHVSHLSRGCRPTRSEKAHAVSTHAVRITACIRFLMAPTRSEKTHARSLCSWARWLQATAYSTIRRQESYS